MLSNFQNKKNNNLQREEKQFIVFSISGENFGVGVNQIRQIIPVMESTHVPNAPSFVKGVIDLRGDIIPIVNLREKLSFKDNDIQDKNSKIIIVELNKNIIGMEVDSVSEMMRVYADEISEAPKIVKGISKNYLDGVVKHNNRLLILLDLSRTLSDKEIMELDNIES